jgi:hypothetical protein
MHGVKAIALGAALCIGPAAFAEETRCPNWEPGASYPWQSNEIVPGDRFAWLALDVDRGGYPFRCRIGNNNYVDPEARFWLCKSYSDRWRGPRAAASGPERRLQEGPHALV